MKVARCPGSCGELIQGIILGSEKLISYPINCYSYARILRGARDNELLYPKAYSALEKVFEYFGEDIKISKELKVEIKSEIPVGKGMASSTADLGATILAATKYLKKDISEQEIARICLSIEPTDSTLFSAITLFDHLDGKYIKKYSKNMSCKVLIMEGIDMVDTVEFRKVDKKSILKKNTAKITQALKNIELGIWTDDLRKIGQGAILSALANEDILKKPGLSIIIERALKLGAYGVNIAHSGSVVGIIYDDRYFDKEAFLQNIRTESFMNSYINIGEYETVKGGPEIIEMEG
ncbi:hypothetical protein [Clostridiisalibacter paucivorans]|uniref:GHMP family kinase ATP-binding protein n=1 Tax=Clostridiisalibacter paucivorans TaxID=408753 RepID=UPI000685C742|nr:hypothetical protein [Clostridiisalibacter paucivorans]